MKLVQKLEHENKQFKYLYYVTRTSLVTTCDEQIKERRRRHSWGYKSFVSLQWAVMDASGFRLFTPVLHEDSELSGVYWSPSYWLYWILCVWTDTFKCFHSLSGDRSFFLRCFILLILDFPFAPLCTTQLYVTWVILREQMWRFTFLHLV